MDWYIGIRSSAGDVAVWKITQSFAHPLPMRRDVCHASDGFEWGDRGEGTRQLAFALLCDVTNDPEAAVELVKWFHRDFIHNLPRGGWCLAKSTIESWIVEVVATHANRDVIELGLTEGGGW